MKEPRVRDFKKTNFSIAGDYDDLLKYSKALEKYINFLKACREYDASGENRPDGYVLANYHTAKRQDGE